MYKITIDCMIDTIFLVDINDLDMSNITANHIMMFCTVGAGMFLSVSQFYDALFEIIKLIGPLVDGASLELPLSFEYLFTYANTGVRSIVLILYNYHVFLKNPLTWKFMTWNTMKDLKGCVFHHTDPYVEAPWLINAIPKEGEYANKFKNAFNEWIVNELSTCIDMA